MCSCVFYWCQHSIFFKEKCFQLLLWLLFFVFHTPVAIPLSLSPRGHPHLSSPPHLTYPLPEASSLLRVRCGEDISTLQSSVDEFFICCYFCFFETLCLGSPGSSETQKINQCLNWDIHCRSLSSAGVKGLHHLAFLTCSDMTTLETSAWGLRRLFFSCRVDDFPRCATQYWFSVLFMVVFLNGRYWSLSASPSICFL